MKTKPKANQRAGAEIRRRREAKNLTGVTAAKRAGVSQARWYRWEDGKGLTPEALAIAAKALRCQPAELLG